MYVAIMMVVIMIFLIQLLGFEYLRHEIKKAVLKKYDDVYTLGYNTGYEDGWRIRRISIIRKSRFKVTEEGFISARK